MFREIMIIIGLVIDTYTNRAKRYENYIQRDQNVAFFFLSLDDYFQEYIRSKYSVKSELKSNSKFFKSSEIDLILDEVIQHYEKNKTIVSHAEIFKILNKQRKFRCRYYPIVISEKNIWGNN